MENKELKNQLFESFINFNKLPIDVDYEKKLSKLETTILFIIYEAGEDGLVADNAYINKRLFISKESLSRVINGLRIKGYISIKKNPKEFRKNYYELRSKGRETCITINKNLDKILYFILKSIGEDDAKNFVRILTKLFTSFELIKNKERD